MPARCQNPTAQFVWGLSGAAAYLGVSRGTFWNIRNDDSLTPLEKKLLTPRIVRGTAGFKKSDLDQFMNPSMNAPGAVVYSPLR